jgi:hypothetical protein
MASRKHTKIGKKGHEEEWSWEESPEVLEALSNLHKTVQENKVKLDRL